MVNVFKILLICTWKTYLMRNRNWVITVFTILVPLWPILLMWWIDVGSCGIDELPFLDSYPPENKLNVHLAYAPSNRLTDELMDKIKDCALEEGLNNRVSKHEREEDIEDVLKKRTINGNKTIGVIFYQINEDSHLLEYKIRVNSDMVTEYTNDYFNIFTSYYSTSGFITVQSCVDVNILRLFNVSSEQINFEIGPLPYIYKTGYDPSTTVVIGAVLSVIGVVTFVIKEKSHGVSTMIKALGVPGWIIWAQWLIFNMVVYLPISLGITIITTVIQPTAFRANPVIVWLLLILYYLNTVVYLFLISCLLNSLKIQYKSHIFYCFMFTFVSVLLKSPKTVSKSLQFLLCFINPHLNLTWALNTIYAFAHYTSYVSTPLLFTVGFTGSYVPIGASILLFFISTSILMALTLYLDSVILRSGGFNISFYCIYNFIRNIRKSPDEQFETKPPSSNNYQNYELPKKATVGIEVRGLCKVYDRDSRIFAVDHVDLDLYEGEITVLLGHNGSGKSTLMSMITGMIPATSGTIKVNGKPVQQVISQFRANLGLCTQHDLYFSSLTVIEHVILFGVLKGMSFKQAKEEGERLLKQFKIQNEVHVQGRKLSGGTRRRLCLANSLVGRPKVLVLDEPTAGLDPESRRLVWNIISGLRGSCTILITTQLMEEAEVLGDRIAIMDCGRVVCFGTSSFLKNLYGSGYHVHLLKKPSYSAADIVSAARESVSDVKIRVVSSSQIYLTIKQDYLDQFPSLLHTLENSMELFGVTEIHVSSSSIEEVFLRVSEQSTKQGKEYTSHDIEEITRRNSQLESVDGFKLFKQRLEALFTKRWLHLKRGWLAYLLRLLISSFLFFITILFSPFVQIQQQEQKAVNVSLGELYPGSVNLVNNISDSHIKEVVKYIFEKENGNVSFLGERQSIHDFIANQANKDYLTLLHKTLLGLNISSNVHRMQFQQALCVHCHGIAINIIANILLKCVHKEGQIKVINHPYVHLREGDCPLDEDSRKDYIDIKVQVGCALLALAITVSMPGSIDLVSMEVSCGFKHQQIIAGLTPYFYWCFNFMFDLGLYLLTVVVWILIILIVGLNHILIDNTDFFILFICIIILNGLSTIAFLYFLVHLLNLRMSDTFVITCGTACFVVAQYISYIWDREIFNYFNYELLSFICFVSCFIPILATFVSIIRISNSIVKRNICRVCNDPGLYGKESISEILDINTFDSSNNILICVMFLTSLWILYLSLLLLLDSNAYRRLLLIFLHKKRGHRSQIGEDGEDIVQETTRVKGIKSNKNKIPLILDCLTKKFYCGPKAVNGVSFIVEKGDCFGLLGVNGAGKTTIFKVLAGYLLPNNGHAEISGVSVFNKTKVVKRIGYCPQFDAFLNIMTGKETLETIALIRGVPRSDVGEEIKLLLGTMGMTELGDQKISTFSAGTKRKLSTALAFMGRPEVVLLDEPTNGVDPVSRHKLWTVIKTHQRGGQAVVISSHSMQECEVLCNRLTILKGGRMKCIGDVEHLKKKYRLGFAVDVKLSDPTEEQIEQLKETFMASFLMSELVDEGIDTLRYRVHDPEMPLSQVFSLLLEMKNSISYMQEFNVNSTTLDYLFLLIATDA